MEKNIIPICFAIDDAYTPFLAVALQSLIDNASKEYNYCIKVLHTNVKEEHMKQIKKYENVLNIFFTQAYADIKSVKYVTEEKDDKIRYKLFFNKMID